MSSGRVYCILIATPARQVVFERFYDTFTDAEKAEIRGAFDQLADSYGAEAVGRYKWVGLGSGGVEQLGWPAAALRAARHPPVFAGMAG